MDFVNVDDLQQHLTSLEEKSEGKDVSLASLPRWVFVKKVVITAPFPLLKLVTIVDLPGTDDGDQIRSSLALNFISSLKARLILSCELTCISSLRNFN